MLRSDFHVQLVRATRHKPSAQNGLITFEVAVSRDIWTEILTHRLAERNASSRRAMSSKRIVATHGAWVPSVFYGPAERGMGDSGRPLSEQEQRLANEIWLDTLNYVEQRVLLLSEFVSKQQVNRLLTGAHITCGVLTMTEAGWRNFLSLRDTEHADRAMREEFAAKIKVQIANAEWTISDWHTPYCEDVDSVGSWWEASDKLKIGAAKIARWSYGNPPVKTPEEDLTLASDLIANRHASPFGHLARIWNKPEARSALNCYPSDVDSEGWHWRTFRHYLDI